MGAIPQQRRPEHEIGIRELRNAGKVMAQLIAAGAIGRVTSDGRLVGWLIPAGEDERHTEDLVARGRLTLPVRPTGWNDPLPARSDVPPLSDTLRELREAEER